MSIDYKDLLIYDLYLEYETGLYSLSEIAQKHGFPSVKVLEKAFKKYYKQELKKNFNPKNVFSQTEKDKILDLYMNKGYSLNKLAVEYGVSTYRIKKVLMEYYEFRVQFDVKNKNRTEKVDISSEELENIISDLTSGKSLNFVRNKYSLPDSRLKKILKSDARGREILYKNLHINYTEVPIDELTQAYLNKDLKSLEEKYNLSASALYYRLRKAYGDDFYVKLNQIPKTSDVIKKVAILYEQGLNYEQIAEQENLTVPRVQTLINKYYRLQKKKKPKILSKDEFLKQIENGQSIDEIINKFQELGFLIPDSYIDEQYKKQDGINLRKVKSIVLEQLSLLKKAGKSPNYITPFNLPNQLKEQGYSNKYYATALLYRLIDENNLSLDILDEIDNKEVVEAVKLLLNSKDEKQIAENDLAKEIYTAEQQDLNSDEKPNNDGMEIDD